MSDESRVDELPSPRNIPPHPRFVKDALAFFMPIRPFNGIIRDVKARGSYYISDWTDAWNYRVVPATALTFFSKYSVLAYYCQ
jgi:hypothetical protein